MPSARLEVAWGLPAGLSVVARFRNVRPGLPSNNLENESLLAGELLRQPSRFGFGDCGDGAFGGFFITPQSKPLSKVEADGRPGQAISAFARAIESRLPAADKPSRTSFMLPGRFFAKEAPQLRLWRRLGSPVEDICCPRPPRGASGGPPALLGDSGGGSAPPKPPDLAVVVVAATLVEEKGSLLDGNAPEARRPVGNPFAVGDADEFKPEFELQIDWPVSSLATNGCRLPGWGIIGGHFFAGKSFRTLRL
mmetsp:Transcript_72701/g.151777  ORF Transcript_72701/g.151777 Transcript_72701/m.151777 type:complete len:251 (+) Transcript_72701:710-1462(+)